MLIKSQTHMTINPGSKYQNLLKIIAQKCFSKQIVDGYNLNILTFEEIS